MKIKFTQFRWFVTMLLLVTAMAMPKMAWAETYNQNGFAEAGSYQPATLTTGQYDINGDGTKDEVYEIGNAGQLYWFAGLVNGTIEGETQNASANAVLTADITVNTGVLNENGTLNNNGSGLETWTPIGNSDSYTGTFDGQGHTISGLYNNSSWDNAVGLFGGNSGTIKNVGVVDSYFYGYDYVGGVCVLNENGTITGCYNTGTVSGNSEVGGVCGHNDGGTITGCYNTGTVSGSGYYVGGVCGSNFKGGTITGCYTNNGGVCGYDEGTITDDCGEKSNDDFTNGTVCTLLNTALKNANASVRFYRGANYPELIKNLPSLVGDVYQISNKEELYAFALVVNKNVETSANAVLTADITVNTGVLKNDGTLNNNSSGFDPWTPIGNDQNPYTGTFDGQGHTISGLYFNDIKGICVGLFGLNSGTIKNVTMFDSYLHGQQFIGGVCGYNLNEVTNCSYTGIVNGSGSKTYAGGVSGCNDGKITNCHTVGAVSGNMGIGGMCGLNGGSIIACYNIGTVSGTQYTGGVCGYNEKGSIKSCYYLEGCNAEGTTFDCAEGTSKTAEQFNSGEVCYLLNGNRSEGTEENPLAWYQNIDKEGAVKDAYPVLDNTHGVAYQGTVCTSYYSNTKDATGTHLYPAEYDNGFKICSRCGNRVYQPAKLNANAQYEIGNAGQLYWFAAMVNGTLAGVTQNLSANAILTADITVNKNLLASISIDGSGEATAKNNVLKWKRIGKDISDDDSDKEEVQYAGTFDGQGHTISGLYFNEEFKNGIGLFGFVSGAYIKNVGVVDSYLRGFNGGGGVCGLAENSTIENCYNTGYVFAGNVCSGGVCGAARNTTIDNCYNTGTVRGRETIDGGVCGEAVNSIIKNCYNTGSVIGAQVVGGVCATVGNSTIENCYNTGSINGSGNIGGVCGDISNAEISNAESAIINCYNSGEVIGNGNALNTGGVCGMVCGGIILNCHNVGKISTENINIGGIFGAINEYYPYYYSNCYYQKGCNAEGITFNNDYGTSKTKEQFESGEVCYLLSQGSTVVNEEENTSKYYSGAVWGQEIGIDKYPVLGSYKVIKAAKGDKDANENDTYWATFSNLNSDVTLSVPSARNLKVYNATVSGGTLTLSERTDSQVAKGEGVLLKTDKEYVNAKENETDNLTKADYTDNNLVATPATEQTINAETGYKLYRLTYNKVDTKEGLGFYLGLVKDAEGTVLSQDGSQLKATPGKAYLKVSTAASIKPSAAAPTRGFPFSGEGETTSIDEIVIEGDAGISGTANADGRIYNLQGQQVSAPAKGLYIKNNKKVLIK